MERIKLSKKFHVAGRLVLLSCHWRMTNLWKWPPFYLSAKRVRNAEGRDIGFTSLLLGCEFAVLKGDDDGEGAALLWNTRTASSGEGV